MTYVILDSIKNKNENSAKEKFSLDVLTGFSSTPKKMMSKYLYDDKGSHLFKEIMNLEEYYPTDCEKDILSNQSGEIVNIFSSNSGSSNSHLNIVELGAGDGRKTKHLVKKFTDSGIDFSYVPIDISEFAVQKLIDYFTENGLEKNIEGVVGEYFEALNYINSEIKGQNFLLFLGGNIGNFNHNEAVSFLKILWKKMNDGDHILIGFDLKKDFKIISKAYNDSKNVTAEFNLNLLDRINDELGGEFDRKKFFHHSFFNPVIGAMESYIVSKEKQTVHIQDLERNFNFEAYEPIHLEYSFKYKPSDIEALAAKTGFQVVKNLYDSKNYFVDSIWKASKQPRN